MLRMPEYRRKNYQNLQKYIRIARIDHWVKNIFVLPGIAFALITKTESLFHLVQFVAGMLAVGLIASANYVINEYLDAEFDRHHPVKNNRPAALRQLDVRIVLAEYCVLALLGLGLALTINSSFALTGVALLISGVVYNVRPLRTKEKSFLDVLSESINNPLRFIFGWYMFDGGGFPPSSILIAFWMGGAYLMALKRYAEFRDIGDSTVAGRYRRSFQFYTERSLLVSALFYAINATLFLGVFLIKYRIEYLLTFPLIALLFAFYLDLSMKPKSAAQAPEILYRERGLIIIVSALVAVFVVLSFVNIPFLNILLQYVSATSTT